MKKIIYMMAGVALASAVSGCVDTEKPVFQMPNEETAKNFIINQSPFQNEFLSTTGDLEDKSTFNIDLKGQPDYGFPTQANYAAQVSLSETFTDEVKDEDGNVVTPANYATLVNKSRLVGFGTFTTAKRKATTSRQPPPQGPSASMT